MIKHRNHLVKFRISTLLFLTLLVAIVLAFTRSTTPGFSIKPLHSVGPVELGMTRGEVLDALRTFRNSKLDQSGSHDYAFGNSISIEYDSSGCVQYIGVSWHDGCGCDYFLSGRHVADFTAPELFSELAKLDGTPNLTYNCDSFLFPRIIATVWQADSQYDYRHNETSPVYGQMGIGSITYAEAVKAE